MIRVIVLGRPSPEERARIAEELKMAIKANGLSTFGSGIDFMDSFFIACECPSERATMALITTDDATRGAVPMFMRCLEVEEGIKCVRLPDL